MMPPLIRLSRLRQTDAMLAMLQETRLDVAQFIAPLFIREGITHKQAIASLPDQYQWSLNDLPHALDALTNVGIRAVLLFGIPETKDACGHVALRDDGIIQQAIRLIRSHAPHLLVITDLCFCEYTSHGHCGILNGEQLDHDKTASALVKQAVSHAEAGAHWVAPSGMIDGMVSAIRRGLDEAGYINTAILSYAVKYQSALYGPFREAALGAPQFGDRSSYQMNPGNVNEAMREAWLDVTEGADMLMVKPAGHYLDVIYRVKQRFPDIPLCAYQVSGEYAAIIHAANAGAFSQEAAMLESLIAIRRSGADLTISYFAMRIAKWLLKA